LEEKQSSAASVGRSKTRMFAPLRLYISSDRVCVRLSSPKKRVGMYTIVAVITMIVLGLYIFLELNFVVGFLVVMLAALVYYSSKRLEGIG
jgi:hypothetical protein